MLDSIHLSKILELGRVVVAAVVRRERKKKKHFLYSLGKLEPLIHHKTCNVCALTDRSWLCMAYVMSHTQQCEHRLQVLQFYYICSLLPSWIVKSGLEVLSSFLSWKSELRGHSSCKF